MIAQIEDLGGGKPQGRRAGTRGLKSGGDRQSGDWRKDVADMFLECAGVWDEAAAEHRRQSDLALAHGNLLLAAVHLQVAQHEEGYAEADRRSAEGLVQSSKFKVQGQIT